MNFLQSLFFGTAEIVIPMRSQPTDARPVAKLEGWEPAFYQGDRLHLAVKGASDWSILAVDVQTSCVQSSERSPTICKDPRGAKLCYFALDGDRYGSRFGAIVRDYDNLRLYTSAEAPLETLLPEEIKRLRRLCSAGRLSRARKARDTCAVGRLACALSDEANCPKSDGGQQVSSASGLCDGL